MAGGKTIVHCIAGVSRSVSLCAAYLMTNFKSEKGIWRKGNMGAEEAVQYIQKKRRCANPNPGFMKQLMQFEKREKDMTKTFVANSYDTKENVSKEKGGDMNRETLEIIEKIIEDLKLRHRCTD